MRYLPLTMIFIMSASLLVAVVFVPALGALFGKPGADDMETLKSIKAAERGDLKDLGGFTGAYARLIGRLLHHPLKVIAAAAASLVLVTAAYATFGKGAEFFTDTEVYSAIIHIAAQGNLSSTQMRDLVLEVERQILPIRDIRTVFTRTGRNTGGRQEGAPRDSIGTIRLELVDWNERGRGMNEILAEIRQRTSGIPGIRIFARKQEGGPPVSKDIILEITSHDKARLDAALQRISGYMRNQVSGLTDIEDSSPFRALNGS